VLVLLIFLRVATLASKLEPLVIFLRIDLQSEPEILITASPDIPGPVERA
jgi:hypothetical protein